MRTLLTVFKKEVVDNFRDRRTMASALLMGPLFGPLLFAFVINLSIEQSLSNLDAKMELPVIGSEYAPNLMRYMHSRNIVVVDGPETREAAIDAVTTGAHDLVVVIPEVFGEQFAEATPARIELITDQANTQADREARRARNAINAYSQELAAGRLAARGINAMLLRPINVDEVDVSTPSGRSISRG